MIIKKSLLFFSILLVLYCFLCFILPRSLISNLEPGGYGHSFARFREINAYKNIDILFLGGSRCYRGFDPRIFNAAGISVFNLGSTAQSPLNSYYLLQEYLDGLNPKMVVMEVCLESLSLDGVESFLDIAVNHKITKNIALMGLALNNFHSLNTLPSEYLKRLLWRPLTQNIQKEILNDRYIPRGYVEMDRISLDKSCFKNYEFIIEKRQLRYLRNIIELVQRQGKTIVLITIPVPKKRWDTISDYQKVVRFCNAMAKKYNIRYHNFNPQVFLDDVKDFKDAGHLNSSGVKKFNEEFIKINKLN